MSLFFLLFLLISSAVASELVLEPGYSVSTVLDFNRAPSTVNPFSILPRHRSKELLLLDSTNSAFYSIPTPISQEREVTLVSGKGVAGFSDGVGTAAMFDRPKSFAVDGRDNVYVADCRNRAIRKISTSGFTTTIAGGYSEKTGHIDGPAQNASFSNKFDLVYVPTMCAILISDRTNQLIRQIDLKPEDCAQKSQSGLGATYVSAIAAICILVGAVFGFVVRPFFAPRTGSLQQPLYQPDMEALPNQSGENDADGLLRRQKRNC
ncbi:Uncharacterized protein M6B38_234805 [Iris pallida]|uniref:NHL repeat-containing protein n=1 Tax=Iris pallida TaxID=29817 RepID=A0AAX6DPG0_IRIPA|nr:Uncharacterized protein M6B38_234805 [Iris pallida]